MWHSLVPQISACVCQLPDADVFRRVTSTGLFSFLPGTEKVLMISSTPIWLPFTHGGYLQAMWTFRSNQNWITVFMANSWWQYSVFLVRWVESLEGLLKGPFFPLYVLWKQEDSLLLRLYGWRRGAEYTGSTVRSHLTGWMVGSRGFSSFASSLSGWVTSNDLFLVFQWTSGLPGKVQLCPKWWLTCLWSQWHCLIWLIVGKCPFSFSFLENLHIAVKSGN